MPNKLMLVIIIIFIVLPMAAKADIGPKPSMEFNLIYKTSKPLEIISGEQYTCKNQFCLNPEKLEDNGPQGFYCKSNICRSLAYGYDGDYNIIKIKFSDKTRESNIFKNAAFDSIYDVIVSDNKLTVNNGKKMDESSYFSLRGDNQITPNESSYFSSNYSFNFTIAIELLIGFIFISRKKLPKKLLLVIFIINLGTLTAFQSVLSYNYQPKSTYYLTYFISEIFITLIEALFFYGLFRKKLTWKVALQLSLVINLSSVLIGELIYLVR